MAEIGVRNLQKRFGEFVAVRESSFTIHGGEFFVMLGPSGCGKTTTPADDRGSELPTSGQILIDGDDVTPSPGVAPRCRVHVPALRAVPHMNVHDNIAFPLKCQGCRARNAAAASRRPRRCSASATSFHRRVSGLAGGDRQRVALGRAIVRRPKAFLMDEPLGALDAEFRELMCGELRTLHERLHATTLYVTHDQLEAMSMADSDHRHEPRGDRAGRRPAGDLRPAPDHVRRRLHRQSADELSPFRGRGAGRAILDRDRRRGGRGAGAARVASSRSPRSRGPSRAVRFSDASALRGAVFGTEYLGTTQIVTVETDPRAAPGARAPRASGWRPARTSASNARPNVWWCSTRRAAAPSTATCTGEARMADVSLRGVTGCFGGQVACTPVRPVGFDAAGGRILGRRPVPECPAWLTCR